MTKAELKAEGRRARERGAPRPVPYGLATDERLDAWLEGWDERDAGAEADDGVALNSMSHPPGSLLAAELEAEAREMERDEKTAELQQLPFRPPSRALREIVTMSDWAKDALTQVCGLPAIPARAASPAELRPTPEHAGKPLHWVQKDPGEPECWTWLAERSAWMWCDPDLEDRINGYSGCGDTTGTRDAYLDGYRYLGPAEWRPEQPMMVALAQPDGSMRVTQMRTDAEAETDRLRIAGLQTECHGLLADIYGPHGYKIRVAKLEAEAARLQKMVDDAGAGQTVGAGQTAPDHSAEAVQRRVEGVIDDLVAGRTTLAQRNGLGSATERADRVRPGSDAAVGRAAAPP